MSDQLAERIARAVFGCLKNYPNFTEGELSTASALIAPHLPAARDVWGKAMKEAMSIVSSCIGDHLHDCANTVRASQLGVKIAARMIVARDAGPPDVASPKSHDLNCPMWMMQCECVAPPPSDAQPPDVQSNAAEPWRVERTARMDSSAAAQPPDAPPWIHGHEFQPMANALVCEKCGNFGYAHSRLAAAEPVAGEAEPPLETSNCCKAPLMLYTADLTPYYVCSKCHHFQRFQTAATPPPSNAVTQEFAVPVGDMARAIADAEYGRQTHQQWLDYLEHPHRDTNDGVVIEDVGSAEHQREWIARYDNILACLRAAPIPADEPQEANR